jgi:membrane-associated phospholipid phosphatase
MSTDVPVAAIVRRDHRSPYSLGQFHARYPWVLPIGAALFVLLAVGAAFDLLFWDEPITRALVDLRTPTLDHVARRVSWFGSTRVVFALAAVLALASWRRCPRLALAIVIIALARPLTEHLLKELVGRERPQGDQLVPGRGPSFPSGHPLATAASWGLVPLVVALYTARRAVFWTSAVIVWALAVTVAASRVWLGVHWTSDVVASLLLASLGVLAAERFIDAMHGPKCGTPRPAFRRVSPPQTGRTPVP